MNFNSINFELDQDYNREEIELDNPNSLPNDIIFRRTNFTAQLWRQKNIC